MGTTFNVSKAIGKFKGNSCITSIFQLFVVWMWNSAKFSENYSQGVILRRRLE